MDLLDLFLLLPPPFHFRPRTNGCLCSQKNVGILIKPLAEVFPPYTLINRGLLFKKKKHFGKLKNVIWGEKARFLLFYLKLLKLLKYFKTFNTSTLSKIDLLRRKPSFYPPKKPAENANCLMMRNLRKQKWPKKTNVLFGHFHSAKIHIVFIPTIIFHKYFSFLSPFLSIG